MPITGLNQFLPLSGSRQGRDTLTYALYNILLMPAEIELAKDTRLIRLKRNLKDPGGIRGLEQTLRKLNDFKIAHLDGRRKEFALE